MVYVTGLQLPAAIYSWAVTELLLTDGHCPSLQVFPAYFLGIYSEWYDGSGVQVF